MDIPVSKESENIKVCEFHLKILYCDYRKIVKKLYGFSEILSTISSAIL